MDKYIVLKEMNNFNDEFFLKCVCNFPVLYDSSKKGYCNRILTDKAWDHISRSMHSSVDVCKKRWKSLREKYYREKQKMDICSRSGAAASSTTAWPLMSFFCYMFDNREPRDTSSNMVEDSFSINSQDLIEESNWGSENIDFTEGELHVQSSQDTFSQLEGSNVKIPSSTPTKKYEKKKKQTTRGANDSEGEMLNILGTISSSIEKVGTSTTISSDKIVNFSKYVESELREFPKNSQEEFIDETIIRLLQIKRKLKSIS